MKHIFFTCLLLYAAPAFCQNGPKIIGRDTYTGSRSEKAKEYYNLGHQNIEHKNYPKAVEYLKMAIAEDPDDIDAYDNLGVAYRQMNNLDSAEYYYLLSHKKYPKGTVALTNLGVVEQMKHNYTKSIDYYNQAVAIDPKDVEGYFGLARMYTLVQKYPEALKNASIAEKYYKEANSPYIGDCYLLECMTYLLMNNKDMARKYMDLAQKSGMTIDQRVKDGLK